MKKLRHKCKVTLSLFVTMLLVLGSINASLATDETSSSKAYSAALTEGQITLTLNAVVSSELPEDTKLTVKKVTSSESEYKDLEKKIEDRATEDHYINNGSSIYDYAFVSDNKEITPEGDVTITMTYSQAYAPSGATNEDEVSLYRLSSPLVNLTKDSKTKITMAEQTNKVTQISYTTSSLDPIALVYREKKQTVSSLKVHYVNAKDTSKELADAKTITSSKLTGEISLSNLSKELANTDDYTYTYQKTTLDSVTGTTILGLKAEKKNDVTKFSYVANGSEDYTPYKGEGESYDVNIYLLYNVEEVVKEDTSKTEETTTTKTDEKTQSTSSDTKEKTDTSTTTETKDTVDEVSDTSSDESATKDTADEVTSTDTKDTSDQADDNSSSSSSTSSSTTKKAATRKAVLRAASTYSVGSLTITDNFAEKGRIEATYSKALPDGATNVKYTWYRTLNSNESVVTRQNTAGIYNIHYDESKATYVDLAADEGDSTWRKSNGVAYRVTLTFTYNGKDYSVESTSWSLRYFGQLENGSFENPNISGTTKYNWPGNYSRNVSTGYTANYQTGDLEAPTNTVNGHTYSDGGHYSSDMIWKTTSDWRYRSGEQYAGTDMEIVNARTGSGYTTAYRMRRNYGAYDGFQFAELNAESAGALYQDVMTHPGQKMNYWLAHMARTKYSDSRNPGIWANSMYLVIAPLSEVKDITTQSQLVSFINSHGGYSDSIDRYAANSDNVTYNSNGILIRKITSNNNGWHYVQHINDGYTPTSSATRFFFVAAGTADSDKTVGNFLDNVGFSQDLPEPSEDKFNLSVSKTITGLTGEQIAKLAKGTDTPFTLTLTNKASGSTETYEALNNLKLQFTATKTDDGYTLTPVSVKENEVKEVGSTVKVSKDANNSVTLNWAFVDKGIESNTYKFKVTESNPSLAGYNVTTTNRVVQTGQADQVGTSPLVTNEFDVKTGSNVTVRFSNIYEKKANLTITKQVTGSQADFTKYFKFNVTIKNLSKNKTFTLDKTNAGSTDNPSTLTSDENGTITAAVYLKNGESIQIKELLLDNEDASYEITEENETYEASYQIDGGSSTSGESTGEKLFNDNDHTVSFTNTRNGEIPTGVQKNYVITLPLIIAGIGFVLKMLKKRNEVE